MKHIKPKGYSESRESGDGIHRYEVIVSEKTHYCKSISCCDTCHKRVRFWCKVINRIENRQNQIIADNRLNEPKLCPHGYKDWDECPDCCH